MAKPGRPKTSLRSFSPSLVWVRRTEIMGVHPEVEQFANGVLWIDRAIQFAGQVGERPARHEIETSPLHLVRNGEKYFVIAGFLTFREILSCVEDLEVPAILYELPDKRPFPKYLLDKAATDAWWHPLVVGIDQKEKELLILWLREHMGTEAIRSVTPELWAHRSLVQFFRGDLPKQEATQVLGPSRRGRPKGSKNKRTKQG